MTRFFTQLIPGGRRGGFTLIEMLVVVVIVALLAGVTFKLIKGVGGNQQRAVTIARLNRIKQAIEAFKAEYGQYPPVNSEQTIDHQIRYGFPDEWTITSVIVPTDQPWDKDKFFQFGLMSYLLPRWRLDGVYIKDGLQTPREAPRYDLAGVLAKKSAIIRNNKGQWGMNNRDEFGNAIAEALPRDTRAAQKWLPYIEDILWPGIGHDETFPKQYIPGEKRNEGLEWQPGGYNLQIITIHDGWDKEFRYLSEPPYTTYRLWSTGDGGTPIYGNIGE